LICNHQVPSSILGAGTKRKRRRVISRKEKTILDLKWNNLTQLKEHFERTGEETVVEFNGAELKTKKYIYGLLFGELKRRNNDRFTPKTK